MTTARTGVGTEAGPGTAPEGPPVAGAVPGAPPAGPVPLARVYRFELVKLFAPWRIRLLLPACWLAPGLFVAAVAQQGTLPTDTLFGRWMHATGWAGPLVVLGFAGSWALPLLTSVVAGDVFAAEDRLGTWRHLLVAVRSPRRIFAAKSLAALSVLVLLVAGLAVSGAVGGLLAVGDRPLVGLDGHLLSPGDAAARVLLAWLCALAPTLALAGIGLLGSVALGRSPMGLLLPAVVALAVQSAQLLPLPVGVRLALPGYAFVSWNGLFTAPVQDGAGRRAAVLGALPLAGLLVLGVGVLTPLARGAGSGITQQKVQRSVATAFAHLYRLQAAELNRPDVTEAQLAVAVACDKGSTLVDPVGPGNDWRCTVSWHLPGTEATGTAVYQLDVAPDGRYVADGDGPKDVNGYFLVRTATGDAPNPLWQFDGNVELLPAPSKG